MKLKLNTNFFTKKIVNLLFALTVFQASIAQSTGKKIDCNFNTPRNSPMPIMNYRSYNDDVNIQGSITVIGENGPDLSSFRKLDIAYTNNQLVTFFYQSQTTFEFIDLIPNTTHTFDQVNPDITLTNTGINNLDGSYYVNIVDNGLRVDLHDFVMVSKTGDFSIYFSSLNSPVYDECIDGELSLSNDSPSLIEFSPGNNRVVSTQSSGQANFFTFQIPDGYELSQLIVDRYEGSDDIGFIGINEGLTIETTPPSFIGGLSYGTANIGSDILPAMGDSSNPAAAFISGFGFTPPLNAAQYTVWLNQTGTSSSSTLNFVISAKDVDLSIADNKIKNGVTLKPNYPNPFDDTTTIEYSLSKKSDVNLDVYTIHGQLIKSLKKGVQSSGSHKLTFDLSNLNKGLYISVLATDKGNLKQLIIKK